MVDVLGDLERLQKLRESGVLNDEEFETQKARLISNITATDIKNDKSAESEHDMLSNKINQSSTFTPVDITTIGIFILAFAMFFIIGPASFLLAIKFSFILSIICAVIIYVDARHIDLQGYDWNRAKWGFTTFALSIITIPVYIFKRDRFIEEISEKYDEGISVLISKIYLIIMYAIFCLTLIYQIFVALNIGSFVVDQPSDISNNINTENSSNPEAIEPAQHLSMDEFTEAEQKIIGKWWEAEVSCRGSNDRTPSGANCPQRQRADLALNGAGLCYGRDDDGSAADYQIHRCGPGSVGYSVPQKSNETCLGYWGTFGATDNDGGLSVEIKSSGGYYIQYSDYGNSKGTWRDLPSKPDAIILTGEQYGDSFTLEKCSSEQPEITYNSDGQFFFLTKFSGDYWSEAERRGITISEGE